MYYEHRVSFDLAFFTAESFRPKFFSTVETVGVCIENVRIQIGNLEADIDGVRGSCFLNSIMP